MKFVSSVVLGGLGVTLAVASQAVAQPTTTPLQGELAEVLTQEQAVDAAADLAQATGEPVVVDELTTQTSLSTVTPDGLITTELSAAPVRVSQGTGWTEVDTTLHFLADGRVAPRAAATDVAFSGGGDQPMAEIRENETTLAWSWPDALPIPELDGDTATYANVLPGVDLQVRAGVDSFSEVLVVKDAAAARNPALRTLELESEVTGGSLLERRDGGLEVRDSTGNQVMLSNPPIMWDSKGAQSATLERLDENAAEISDDGFSAEAPVPGDQVRPVDVEVLDESVQLGVDAALLTSPGTTFPVIIDPQVSGAVRQAWTMVNKTYPTAAYYKWSAASEGLGYVIDYNGRGQTKRLFWDFGTSLFAGKQIINATFAADQTHAYDCAASGVQLWTTHPFNSATTWNAQPTWAAHLATQTRKDETSSCTDKATRLEWNAISAVQWVSSNSAARLGLGLRASSETTQSSWRRFEKDAVLSVTWNSTPLAPSHQNLIAGSLTVPCVASGNIPAINVSDFRLVGRVVDPNNDKLDAHVQYTHTAGSNPRTVFPTRVHAGITSGHNYDVAVTKAPEGRWTWWAKTTDKYAWSPWGPSCAVDIDRTRPAQPTVMPPREVDGMYTWRVGKTVSFVVASSSSDVVKYTWSLPGAGSGTVAVAPGATATINVLLKETGPHALTVTAHDKATNVSAASVPFEFRVQGSLITPKGGWDFNDTSTTTTTGYDGTVLALSGITRAGGYDPTAPWNRSLAMTATSQATTSGALVDTTKSFTAQARVFVPENAAGGTLMSQDAGDGSAFVMGVVMIEGQPYLQAKLRSGQSGVADGAVATSNQPLDVGAWNQLAAVYNAESATVHVVLNEDPGEWVDAQPTASTGPFRLGRARSNGTFVDAFTGHIDSVRLHEGFLTPHEQQISFDQVLPGSTP